MTNILLLATALLSTAPDPQARAVLDSAIVRMGGLPALRAVERVKVESVTEWRRTVLDGRPNSPVLSYEWSTELRDYTRPAWRYSRRFIGASGLTEVIDLVVDSVAAMKVSGRWQPQNIAYIDERTEVFTFSPERLMLLAADASDSKALPDTTIAGTPYARVRATVNGFKATLHFNRRNKGLALVTFRHGQVRDFGLAPWGEMDVAIWYSRWQKLGPSTALFAPTQLDVYRVGKPYKRVTNLGVLVNVTLPADSLVMPDSLRAAYLANGGKAMWDLPIDTAKIVDLRFAVFGTPGTPSGAIKLGGKWLLIEGGTAPVSAERSAAFLARADASAPLGGAIITQPSGSGGIVWLLDQRLPVWVANGARPYVEASLRGWSRSDATKPITDGAWLRVGADSLLVESLDLPDLPSVAVIYVPSLRWAYAFSPTALDRIAEVAQRRGWTIDRVGSLRSFTGVPLPQ